MRLCRGNASFESTGERVLKPFNMNELEEDNDRKKRGDPNGDTTNEVWPTDNLCRLNHAQSIGND